MRKILNFALAITAVGALSAASASAATTQTISFDGFCDGMTLVSTAGFVGGTLTGCETGFALGNNSIDFGLAPLNGTAGLMANVQSSALGSSEIITYYLNFENTTWSVYGATGSVPFLINSGTFSIVAAGTHAPTSGPSSKIARNAPPQVDIPTRNVTIQFSGFCDGMSLTFQGDLIGGTLAGCSTGLAAGNTGVDFNVEPFGSGVQGVAANVGSTANGDGYLLNYYLDFASKEWANYSSTTGQVVFLRTGTFTITAADAFVASGSKSSQLK